MKHSIAISILVCGACVSNPSFAAEPCFRDLGKKDSFGSDEQVKALQTLAKTDCPVIGFTFAIPRRPTLIVADVSEGQMIRLKTNPDRSHSWEAWSGFNKQDILTDDPADGFDLNGFTASTGDEVPILTDRLRSFVRANKLQRFLP